MNTKVIMTASAITLAFAGFIFTFMPMEILQYVAIDTTKYHQLILQTLGALYFSYAMLNWMAKGSIIGGIYNRPIAVANFTHFFIAGLALIKGLISDPNLSFVLWCIASLYAVFALLFGVMLFRHPVSEKKAE